MVLWTRGLTTYWLLQTKTLQYWADRFGLYLISDSASRHFFSKQKYSHYAWCILIKVADKFPKILRIGMLSKTWEDYLLISRNKDSSNL